MAIMVLLLQHRRRFRLLFETQHSPNEKFKASNATTIAVAHRLSTLLLLNTDRILVFDKEKIIEDGTHAELIAKGGVYTKLWNSQTNENNFYLPRLLFLP
jgi:ABC-type multidrug transport system fused ATPase/permease subunit